MKKERRTEKKGEKKDDEGKSCFLSSHTPHTPPPPRARTHTRARAGPESSSERIPSRSHACIAVAWLESRKDHECAARYAPSSFVIGVPSPRQSYCMCRRACVCSQQHSPLCTCTRGSRPPSAAATIRQWYTQRRRCRCRSPRGFHARSPPSSPKSSRFPPVCFRLAELLPGVAGRERHSQKRQRVTGRG